MRYFRIQNHKTKRYIKHGMLVGGWYKFGIGERGFTVGNVSNLFLGSISVDPQKGRIRGSLGDEDFPSRRACTNEGGYIGYRDVTGPHSIQEVTIRFIGGLKEMLNFKNDLKANIKISLQGDGLVDNDDRLMRENGEGDNWYLLHA